MSLTSTQPMLKCFSIDLLNTAIFLLDKESCILDLNNAAEQLFNISVQQVQNKTLFEVATTNFDQTLLHQLTQQQSGFIEDAHLKIESLLVTGNILFSSFNHENNNYILLELQSSQSRQKIQKDLQLQQQNRIGDHLIRNLAHEIKNPLGGIKGAAQLMQRKLPKEFSNQYCDIIIQETNRLDQLVSRLLLPAEPEEKTQLNIHQLIDKAINIVSLQITQIVSTATVPTTINSTPVNSTEIVSIEKDYDPSLPEIQVSEGQILQCLINLIKNATEAIEEAGKIIIRTRIAEQKTIAEIHYKQIIRIDVIDNGCGIPDSMIKDIFFPTISSKNSSGLGLSIAQSLIQRHKGIIEASNHSKNTCFSIYLPITKRNESD